MQNKGIKTGLDRPVQPWTGHQSAPEALENQLVKQPAENR